MKVKTTLFLRYLSPVLHPLLVQKLTRIAEVYKFIHVCKCFENQSFVLQLSFI